MAWYDLIVADAALAWTQIEIALGIIDPSDDDSEEPEETEDPDGDDSTVESPDSSALLGRLQQSGLPDSFTPYLQAIADSGTVNEPSYSGVTNYQFALVLCGLLDRESEVGSALQPPGPSGVGDLGSRYKLKVPDWCAGIYADCVTGNTEQDAKGRTTYEIQPPAAFGAEERGWGYGLGQLDFASYYTSGDFATRWTDPAWHINEVGRHLSSDVDALNSLSAGISAYNCGRGAARTALATGQDPDSKTTGGDYGTDVIRRANQWGAGLVYSAQGG